jgi:hypothetical protein
MDIGKNFVDVTTTREDKFRKFEEVVDGKTQTGPDFKIVSPKDSNICLGTRVYMDGAELYCAAYEISGGVEQARTVTLTLIARNVEMELADD